MITEKRVEVSELRRIFQEAYGLTIGQTFSSMVNYILDQKFGKDPYEVLCDDPSQFYHGFKEVFSDGAEIALSMVGKVLVEKYGVNIPFEGFTAILAKGDDSSKNKFREIMEKAIMSGKNSFPNGMNNPR